MGYEIEKDKSGHIDAPYDNESKKKRKGGNKIVEKFKLNNVLRRAATKLTAPRRILLRERVEA